MDAIRTPVLDLPIEETLVTFLDVETTGLSPFFGDRICEVAAVSCLGGREIGRFSALVNPCRPISLRAAKINGITSDMVADAPRFSAIAHHVLEFIGSGAVVAHNAPFDLAFLAMELGRAGIAVPTQLPVVDTLALARRRFSFPGNSLSKIANHLGIGTVEHRALADAVTTRIVLDRFVDALTENDMRLTLGELLNLQGGPISWPVNGDASSLPVPADLGDALRHGCEIRISYISAQGNRSERVVDPIDVVVRRGSAYLVAYCHLREEQRTFRLDRILEWQRS